MHMKNIHVYMRGGTSKAVFFHEKDQVEDKSLWDDIFLKVMGTPDVKQIDGMGGTVSSTSKIAIIAPSDKPGVDVEYIPSGGYRDSESGRKVNCGKTSSSAVLVCD